MYQRRLTFLLFAPSALSGAATVFIALTMNAYGAWSFIHDNQLFYGFFSGAYGIQTYLWDATYGASVWSNAFLNSPLAYYILVGGVALAAGMAVFAALQLLGVVSKESKAVLEASGNRSYRHEILSKLSLRILSLIGWTLYAAFFISAFLPFISALNEIGVDRISQGGGGGLLWCSASLLSLMLSFHIHVVFARLLVLRPRLFGGIDAIERAESVSEHKLESGS